MKYDDTQQQNRSFAERRGILTYAQLMKRTAAVERVVFLAKQVQCIGGATRRRLHLICVFDGPYFGVWEVEHHGLSLTGCYNLEVVVDRLAPSDARDQLNALIARFNQILWPEWRAAFKELIILPQFEKICRAMAHVIPELNTYQNETVPSFNLRYLRHWGRASRILNVDLTGFFTWLCQLSNYSRYVAWYLAEIHFHGSSILINEIDGIIPRLYYPWMTSEHSQYVKTWQLFHEHGDFDPVFQRIAPGFVLPITRVSVYVHRPSLSTDQGTLWQSAVLHGLERAWLREQAAGRRPAGTLLEFVEAGSATITYDRLGLNTKFAASQVAWICDRAECSELISLIEMYGNVYSCGYAHSDERRQRLSASTHVSGHPFVLAWEAVNKAYACRDWAQYRDKLSTLWLLLVTRQVGEAIDITYTVHGEHRKVSPTLVKLLQALHTSPYREDGVEISLCVGGYGSVAQYVSVEAMLKNNLLPLFSQYWSPNKLVLAVRINDVLFLHFVDIYLDRVKWCFTDEWCIHADTFEYGQHCSDYKRTGYEPWRFVVHSPDVPEAVAYHEGYKLVQAQHEAASRALVHWADVAAQIGIALDSTPPVMAESLVTYCCIPAVGDSHGRPE